MVAKVSNMVGLRGAGAGGGRIICNVCNDWIKKTVAKTMNQKKCDPKQMR